MKFSSIEYKRPNINILQSNITSLISDFTNSKNASNQYKIILKIDLLKQEFETAYALAHVRYSQNTTNEFYMTEIAFFDEVVPNYEELNQKLAEAISNSKYLQELKNLVGDHFINLKIKSLKTINKNVIADLQEENKLATEYTKLMAQAKVKYNNVEYTLSGISRFFQNSNVEIRKESNQAYWNFFDSQKETFDNLYDSLVNVRNKISIKLGYKNFVELAYDRLTRTDYDYKDIEKVRKYVAKYIVPLSEHIYTKQAKRIGLDRLKYYDKSYKFKSGNAKPKGSSDWILEKASQMYSELSPKAIKFWEYMQKNELMDLENRPNKRVGGFCTSFESYKAPFIFANFNGTSHDIEVLTHEFGHAFQYYLSRNNTPIEYRFPTLEACEIHSMAMEFMAWPWMKLFFEEGTNKFLFTHLTGSITFMPYGCMVDEFQQKVYENPDYSADQKAQIWSKLEKIYNPSDYDGNSFLESGRAWVRQHHIFGSPFYYIDYVLAQICALQLWAMSLDNFDNALQTYLKICEIGGKESFTKILQISGLESPFEESTWQKVAKKAEDWINQIDDSQF